MGQYGTVVDDVEGTEKDGGEGQDQGKRVPAPVDGKDVNVAPQRGDEAGKGCQPQRGQQGRGLEQVMKVDLFVEP